jgi:hypothetical protein
MLKGRRKQYMVLAELSDIPTTVARPHQLAAFGMIE